MSIQKKELKSEDEELCPYCLGMREDHFMKEEFAREFLSDLYAADRATFSFDPAELNEKDAKGVAWLIYHKLCEDCTEYQADVLMIKKDCSN